MWCFHCDLYCLLICLYAFFVSNYQALFMPYDHKNTIPAGLAGHVMKSVLEDLNRRHFQKKCLVGSGGGSVGYVPCYALCLNWSTCLGTVFLGTAPVKPIIFYHLYIYILYSVHRLWLNWHQLSVDWGNN